MPALSEVPDSYLILQRSLTRAYSLGGYFFVPASVADFNFIKDKDKIMLFPELCINVPLPSRFLPCEGDKGKIK